MKCTLVKGNGHTFDHLHYSENGFSCKLVPAFGGSLQELIVDDNKVTWGCPPDADGMQAYKEFCNGAWLFPFPNRVENGQYNFNDVSYHLDINDRKLGHAIHGLVYNQPFEIVDYNDHSAHMRYNFPGNQGFPFPFEFSIRYDISSRDLKILLSVKNTGKSSFPMGIGWHPYFQYEDPKHLKLEFNAIEKYTQTNRMIPVHSEPWSGQELSLTPGSLDDAFRLGNTFVSFTNSAYQLSLKHNLGSYLQLYTPINKQTVAIEPMSCIGNAFNNGIGLQTLGADESVHWEVQLHIS